MTQSALGSIISSLRKQHNLTQAALGEKLGVTDKAVSKWERGISYPDVSLFPKLANILGVTTDDLLKEFAEGGTSSRLKQIFKSSDDIRMPLHVILCCTQLAQTHLDDPKLLQRHLESIQISCEYLLDAVNSVVRKTNKDADDLISPVNLDDCPCSDL